MADDVVKRIVAVNVTVVLELWVVSYRVTISYVIKGAIWMVTECTTQMGFKHSGNLSWDLNP